MNKTRLILGTVISAVIAGAGMAYAAPAVKHHGFYSNPTAANTALYSNYQIRVDNNTNYTVTAHAGSFSIGINPGFSAPIQNDNNPGSYWITVSNNQGEQIFSAQVNNHACVEIEDPYNPNANYVKNDCLH